MDDDNPPGEDGATRSAKRPRSTFSDDTKEHFETEIRNLREQNAELKRIALQQQEQIEKDKSEKDEAKRMLTFLRSENQRLSYEIEKLKRDKDKQEALTMKVFPTILAEAEETIFKLKCCLSKALYKLLATLFCVPDRTYDIVCCLLAYFPRI